jgi:hypothetical protein
MINLKAEKRMGNGWYNKNQLIHMQSYSQMFLLLNAHNLNVHP